MQTHPTILMVSGGSDSSAMLEMCSCGDIECGPFAVLHVNHMLRGKDSELDEKFVVSKCMELCVECCVVRIDIKSLAKNSADSIEAVARDARYAAANKQLATFCEKLDVSFDQGRIYTAHTLDDRVETFYMRTLVGTGPGGLASIPRSRENVLRPLLDYTREELREYLRNKNPGKVDVELWREDKTNFDGTNFRSAVRMKLIPVLSEMRPGFKRSLSRTMDLISDEQNCMNDLALSKLMRVVKIDTNTVTLPVDIIAETPKPISRRILREALLLVDENARLESEQIERVLEGCGVLGFTTEVSGGIRVNSDSKNLILKKLGLAHR